jgi:RNA polymerase sigma-70 factor (ECF subfamily)
MPALLKPETGPVRSNPVVDTVPGAAEAAVSEGTNEQEWIERARAGDTEAFRKLVERHSDRAYGLAFRMLGSASEAEEAAQDAFFRAWRALPQFRGESSFSTWLHRIVVRRALDRQAAMKSRRAREAPLDEAIAQGFDAASPGEGPDPALRRRLDRLLGTLSPVQRAIVMLYYYEDRSVDEAASALGLPQGTVKTHLHRARALLRAAWLSEDRTG